MRTSSTGRKFPASTASTAAPPGQPGGTFDGTQNVSVGGNTVWFRDSDGDVRSAALGACDTAKGYTGLLGNPPGPRVPEGDKGCGFAYGDVRWDTGSYEQQSAILNLEHPLGEDAELHRDANIARNASAFRYAPSVGTFILGLGPDNSLLTQIETATGAKPSGPGGGATILAAHRFLGHGNRDWVSEADEYDAALSVEGRLTEGLGYEARVEAYRLDGFWAGSTFVHEGKRETVAAFAEMSLPVADNLDLRAAGRRDDHDDVGHADSWRLAAEYRPSGIFTLRSSWSAGERTPSMRHLHSTAAQDAPYIQCDPGPDDANTTLPRTCTPNPLQVTREITGNPELDFSGAERLAIGAEARQGPFFLGLEWSRLLLSDLAGLNDANWAVLNLPECVGESRENCLDRDQVGGVTIHDSYANVVDTEVRGVTTRFGGGFRTSWGVVGMRGAWRRVLDTSRTIAGADTPLFLPKNMIRVGVLARRGGLSAI